MVDERHCRLAWSQKRRRHYFFWHACDCDSAAGQSPRRESRWETDAEERAREAREEEELRASKRRFSVRRNAYYRVTPAGDPRWETPAEREVWKGIKRVQLRVDDVDRVAAYRAQESAVVC
jgi:hypothetical protein